MVLRARRHPRINRPSRAPIARGQQQSTEPFAIPAPVAGVNLYDDLASMGPNDSIYAYNALPTEYGLRTRPGHRVWCSTLGSATNPVRTIIPFVDDAGSDVLFATTRLGIYDVTASADNPLIDTSFGTQSGNAGYGNWIVYNNDNGDHFLQFADWENGLYEYDVGAGTWAAATDITGVSETNLVQVVEHKNRLWYVEDDTSDAWYLAVGTKGGTATKFSLGNKFQHGGRLQGIYTWSVDGGDGTDDMLVFVSSAGDVVIYQGTDPSSADTWQAVGQWFIGALPDSRHVAENIGGELHLLSVYGLISIQDLVSGVDISKATGQNTIAKRITRAIRNDMVTKSGDEQWDMITSPSEGAVIITRPFDTNEEQLQYVFSFTYPGWGFWRGIPMNCAAEYNGTLYFGDDEGNVQYMTGSRDDVARDGSGGDAIQVSLLHAFTDAGAPGITKKAHYVRPYFFSESGVAPSYNSKVLFDFDIIEPVLSLPALDGDGAVWDTAVWDAAIWGGTSSTDNRLIGLCGMGDVMALALKMQVTDRTTLLKSNVYAEAGGMIL